MMNSPRYSISRKNPGDSGDIRIGTGFQASPQFPGEWGRLKALQMLDIPAVPTKKP